MPARRQYQLAAEKLNPDRPAPKASLRERSEAAKPLQAIAAPITIEADTYDDAEFEVITASKPITEPTTVRAAPAPVAKPAARPFVLEGIEVLLPSGWTKAATDMKAANLFNQSATVALVPACCDADYLKVLAARQPIAKAASPTMDAVLAFIDTLDHDQAEVIAQAARERATELWSAARKAKAERVCAKFDRLFAAGCGAAQISRETGWALSQTRREIRSAKAREATSIEPDDDPSVKPEVDITEPVEVSGPTVELDTQPEPVTPAEPIVERSSIKPIPLSEMKGDVVENFMRETFPRFALRDVYNAFIEQHRLPEPTENIAPNFWTGGSKYITEHADPLITDGIDFDAFRNILVKAAREWGEIYIAECTAAAAPTAKLKARNVKKATTEPPATPPALRARPSKISDVIADAFADEEATA